MEFKIVERYDPVTPTKVFKKIRQNKDNRQHKKKIDRFFPCRQLHVQS